MKATTFDEIARELGSVSTRRGFFRLLGVTAAVGSGVALMAGEDAEARAKRRGTSQDHARVDAQGKKKKPCPPCKKRKKDKCKKNLPDGTVCAGGTCQGGSCVTSSLPGPTCTDRVKNGSETDVDCGGGSCPRCVDGKTCSVENDCGSGACPNGVCVACTPLQLCGSDARGACQCHQAFPSNAPVCDSGQMLNELTVDSCAKCPAGTETCVTINGGLLFNCFKRCGSP